MPRQQSTFLGAEGAIPRRAPLPLRLPSRAQQPWRRRWCRTGWNTRRAGAPRARVRGGNECNTQALGDAAAQCTAARTARGSPRAPVAQAGALRCSSIVCCCVNEARPLTLGCRVFCCAPSQPARRRLSRAPCGACWARLRLFLRALALRTRRAARTRVGACRLLQLRVDAAHAACAAALPPASPPSPPPATTTPLTGDTWRA